jgi:hypothetical protein
VTGYAELQVTSNYSFLRGASHVEELLAAAKLLGLPAVAITDRNSRARITAPRKPASGWSSAAGSICATACPCWSIRSTGAGMHSSAAC